MLITLNMKMLITFNIIILTTLKIIILTTLTMLVKLNKKNIDVLVDIYKVFLKKNIDVY
jgi:hypothetical protein